MESYGHGDVDEEDIAYLEAEISDWAGDERQATAEYAIYDYFDRGNERSGLLLLSEWDEVQAIASTEEWNEHLYVGYAATKQPGYGRAMWRELAGQAVEKGKGLMWSSYKESVGYYEHIGFGAFREGQGGGSGYRFTVPYSEVAAWLRSQ